MDAELLNIKKDKWTDKQHKDRVASFYRVTKRQVFVFSFAVVFTFIWSASAFYLANKVQQQDLLLPYAILKKKKSVVHK